MSQDTLTASQEIPEEEHNHSGSLLGPLLCWAVVFADIGTSVYYVPGILYGNVGNLAGFFVFLTMSVFVLLTLKYAEVTYRFPQGGGVVTVAATSLGKWFGALGGMFILVDYFLTSSISSLSGMQYLSVVFPSLGVSVKLPAIGSIQLLLLLITIGVLILLGILNWVGVSESAKVSLVGAVIAFGSDIAILVTVFTHLSFAQVLALFPRMFVGHSLAPTELLVGFAGSFLAFSGLESISQLSPVMKTPRKRVAGIALLLVVLTIGITSPLLTMFSTILQPAQAANPILNAQLISLLGGHWGNTILQTEIAISASALLVFASNTAIIGAYHVFLALARLGFFPNFVTKRNALRGTPHYAIIMATGIPIVVLIIVLGNITILGDMYAFGLLGAFTLTCLGMDIIRAREHRSERTVFQRKARAASRRVAEEYDTSKVHLNGNSSTQEPSLPAKTSQSLARPKPLLRLWQRIDFWLGVLTTGLVLIAWSTNLVAKPLATLFGGSVTIIGMGIAFFNYRNQAQGQTPIHVTPLSGVELIPDAILAVLLTDQQEQNARVVQSAIQQADDRPLVLLYVGEPMNAPTPRPFEYYEPYLANESVLKALQQAESASRHANVNITPYLLYQPIRDISLTKEADAIANVWQAMRPHELLIADEDVKMLHDINPDRVRYEWTPEGKVAHLISLW